jgi:hypothetical protein
MRVTDKELLEYLHDAFVSRISFENNETSKNLIIRATFDEDCGDDEWAGKEVVVTLSGVVLTTAILLGHISGQDAVQSFVQGVSAGMRQRLTKLMAVGISIPEGLFTITLQSGSEIEVACEEIEMTAVT